MSDLGRCVKQRFQSVSGPFLARVRPESVADFIVDDAFWLFSTGRNVATSDIGAERQRACRRCCNCRQRKRAIVQLVDAVEQRSASRRTAESGLSLFPRVAHCSLCHLGHCGAPWSGQLYMAQRTKSWAFLMIVDVSFSLLVLDGLLPFVTDQTSHPKKNYWKTHRKCNAQLVN